MTERVFGRARLVGVLTTEPLGRVLDYRAPEGGCGDGDFVEVPLGPRRVLGVVWGPGEGRIDPREGPPGRPGAGRPTDARRSCAPSWPARPITR
jgi:primosomal protein N' (replication factor Y)